MRRILCLTLLFWPTIGCDDPSDPFAPADPNPNEPIILPWLYDASIDELSGGMIYEASLGGNMDLGLADLVLRMHPRYGRDIMLRAWGDGMFTCPSYPSGCTVRVRFDNAPVVSWPYSEAAGGLYGTIFLADYDTFVARMRQSEQVTIEALLYGDGYVVFEFPVAGYEPCKHSPHC